MIKSLTSFESVCQTQVAFDYYSIELMYNNILLSKKTKQKLLTTSSS